MRFRNRTLDTMQENYEQGSNGGPDFVDLIYMDCLATEFVSPVLHTLLPG
jgi:hypothetical protein